MQAVRYPIQGRLHESLLVHREGMCGPVPGLVMVPDWMGVTAASVQLAQSWLAGRYPVLVADLYGLGCQPTSTTEAAELVRAIRADRVLQRLRIRVALAALCRAVPEVDRCQLGAFGFCFGGGTVLELARSGARLQGVVSVHGNLDTPHPAQPGVIRCALQVLHGAEDPLVPQAQVMDFIAEMRHADVDWQLTQYGQAYHSFSNQRAANPGVSEYHPCVAARAACAARAFFAERFAG